jgi:hypothetical protein
MPLRGGLGHYGIDGALEQDAIIFITLLSSLSAA